VYIDKRYIVCVVVTLLLFEKVPPHGYSRLELQIQVALFFGFLRKCTHDDDDDENLPKHPTNGEKNAHMGRLQKSWIPESKSLYGAGHLQLRSAGTWAKFSVLQVKCSGNWRRNRDYSINGYNQNLKAELKATI
jgi:hypothetical protein